MKKIRHRTQNGFSLLELMAVAAIFTIICGVIFGVLIHAQQRYRTESDLLDAFNQANVAIDQMTRDIHQAGYPPLNTFAAPPAPAPAVTSYALPFAWDPGYPVAPCVVGACAPAPAAFDLIVETAPNPGAPVDWIRYQLPAGSHTLLRAEVPKTAGDPVAATGQQLTPYIDGVMNNATPAEIANIRQFYPNLFPNGQVPIFTYLCDSQTAAQGPQPCGAVAAPNNTAPFIREVQITLIVQSQALDPKTRQPRIVTLTAEAERMNPNQQQ